MTNIKLSNLSATNNNSFDDADSYLQDLTDTEIEGTNGGALPRFGCVLNVEPYDNGGYGETWLRIDAAFNAG